MLLILCFSFFFPVSASDAGGCSPESFPEKERRKSRTVRNNHYSLGQGRGQRSGPLEEKLPESSKALRVFCYCNQNSLPEETTQRHIKQRRLRPARASLPARTRSGFRVCLWSEVWSLEKEKCMKRFMGKKTDDQSQATYTLFLNLIVVSMYVFFFFVSKCLIIRVFCAKWLGGEASMA